MYKDELKSPKYCLLRWCILQFMQIFQIFRTHVTEILPQKSAFVQHKSNKCFSILTSKPPLEAGTFAFRLQLFNKKEG